MFFSICEVSVLSVCALSLGVLPVLLVLPLVCVLPEDLNKEPQAWFDVEGSSRFLT